MRLTSLGLIATCALAAGTAFAQSAPGPEAGAEAPPVAAPPATTPVVVAPPPPAAAPAAPAHPAPKCEPCEDPERDASEGAGQFLLGPALLDLSDLNDHLQSQGYEKIPSLMTFIGGEGRGIFRSGFVAGARGGALFGPSAPGPGGVRAKFGAGFGLFDMGYAFIHSRGLLLTLTGGIGGYGSSLGIGDGQSVRFDDALANPRRSVSLSHGGVLTGLTLGFDGHIPTGGVERGRQGFFALGVRVGGLYGPALGEWSISEGAEATGGPSVGLLGGYATIAIGFGGGSVGVVGPRS